MIFCHIFRNLRNIIENMSYPDTSIKALQCELDGMRRKSAQDDCCIARLTSSNESKDSQIRQMTRQMDQMHDERMKEGQQTRTNTININHNAPVVCNGGTLAGNIIIS